MSGEGVEKPRALLPIQSVALPGQHTDLGRVLLNAVPDGVVITNGKGDIEYINHQFELITGFTLDDLLGKQVEFLIPSRFATHKAQRESYLTHPRLRPMGEGLVLWLRRSDDREVPVEISLSPLQTEHGLFVAAFVRDVSQRRKVEIALRESQKLLRCYFDAGLVGMLISTAKRELVQFNDKFCEISGYTREELNSLSWTELTHPDEQLAANHSYLKMLRGEMDSVKRDSRYVRKDGSIVDVRVATRCDRNEDGSVKYFVTFVEDISEQKRAAAELASYREHLEQEVHDRTVFLQNTNQKLQAFVTLVTHDLKAPLRTIEGFCEILCQDYRDVLDDRGMNFLEQVGNSALRMAGMIDRLIKQTQAQADHDIFMSVDLGTIIEMVRRSLSGEIIRHGARVCVEGALPPVYGDPTLLEAVFSNLIGNALKYRAPFRPPVITICATENAREYHVSVRDNGPGISAADRERIFEAYERVRYDKLVPGTGLGLAIVREAVAVHGGRVWVESDGVSWSAFHFTLAKGLERRDP
jgi:PAS domain S-box-containing protein